MLSLHGVRKHEWLQLKRNNFLQEKSERPHSLWGLSLCVCSNCLSYSSNMPPVDSNAKALYHSFNVSQLREVGMAARISSEKLNGMKSREAVIKGLDAISDGTSAAMLAHRVETVSPYKHCVLLEAKEPFTYEALKLSCTKAFGKILPAFQPLNSDDTELVPQLCILDDASERVFIKFAHQVEVFEFKKTDEGILKTKAIKRHIMIATISASRQLAYIAFPGFTQAVSGDQKVTYDYFARQIVDSLEKAIEIVFDGFKLKSATDVLLEDKAEQVVDLRRTLRFKRGGKMALDSESDEDAASALAQGLSNTSGLAISADAIRAAFRSSEAQAIVLLWQKQGLITRLALRSTLPEILFIWDQNTPSLSLVDDILKRFVRARAFVESGGLREASDYIQTALTGEVIRPSWLEQRFALSSDAALKVLLDACTLQLCLPVFRVRADKAFNLLNTWVKSLGELPTSANTEEGELIQTRDPANIEVAFQKLAAPNYGKQVAG